MRTRYGIVMLWIVKEVGHICSSSLLYYHRHFPLTTILEIIKESWLQLMAPLTVNERNLYQYHGPGRAMS